MLELQQLEWSHKSHYTDQKLTQEGHEGLTELTT